MDQLTLWMFGDEKAERFRQVMLVVDKINRKQGRDTLRFAMANPKATGGLDFRSAPPVTPPV